MTIFAITYVIFWHHCTYLSGLPGTKAEKPRTEACVWPYASTHFHWSHWHVPACDPRDRRAPTQNPSVSDGKSAKPKQLMKIPDDDNSAWEWLQKKKMTALESQPVRREIWKIRHTKRYMLCQVKTQDSGHNDMCRHATQLPDVKSVSDRKSGTNDRQKSYLQNLFTACTGFWSGKNQENSRWWWFRVWVVARSQRKPPEKVHGREGQQWRACFLAERCIPFESSVTNQKTQCVELNIRNKQALTHPWLWFR